MYTVGVVLLIISILGVFGTDIFIKKGKIQNAMTILAIKGGFLLLTFAATAILIFGNR